MTLQEVMNQRVFAVVGNTLEEGKYAREIKEALLAHGYTVYAVGKELPSLNALTAEPDVIDLCIHPAKGLRLLQEYDRPCRCVVLQPGAESEDILALLRRRGQPFIQGCVLVGLRLYRGPHGDTWQD